MERSLSIGQLARAATAPAKTLRFYEQAGVLPVPRRNAAGYRQYDHDAVHRLLFVRRARGLGLSLASVKALMAELDGGERPAMRPRLHTLLSEQLRIVGQHIEECQMLERQLAQALQRLQTACPPSHPDGYCGCLDATAPRTQPHLRHRLTTKRNRKAIPVASLGSLTLLAPSPTSRTTGSADARCGCACGCQVSPTSQPAQSISPEPTEEVGSVLSTELRA